MACAGGAAAAFTFVSPHERIARQQMGDTINMLISGAVLAYIAMGLVRYNPRITNWWKALSWIAATSVLIVVLRLFNLSEMYDSPATFGVNQTVKLEEVFKSTNLDRLIGFGRAYTIILWGVLLGSVARKAEGPSQPKHSS
jgi:hypothetical protein